GTIMQLAAWSTDSAGMVASPLVLWHSADPATNLSASGTLEAADAGLSMLVAQSGPLDAVAQVEVTGAPASYLVVWPPTLSVPLGRAGQLAVERTYADGTVQDLSIAAGWRPAPDAGVPVNAQADVDTGGNGGTVRMRAAGTAAVQAVLPGRRAGATLSAPAGVPTAPEGGPAARAPPSAGRTHPAPGA